MFWEPFTAAPIRCPEVMLCLPVLICWAIPRERVSREMLNPLLQHLAFQNNERICK